MELPKIGQQCFDTTCNQLDFLPLKCSCGKIFCSEHFNNHVQICMKDRELTELELKKFSEVYKCNHPDCNVTDVVPLICEKCKNHFCIKHRHIVECTSKDPETVLAEKERYAKPVREFQQAKAVVDEQVEKKLQERKKNEKTRQLANKVQLMKLKNAASGLKSIPTSDRVYFNIYLPQTLSSKTHAVFVSKTWSIGRAIDAISNECKITNNNNKAVEKKLRLFKKEDGQILGQDLAKSLEVLLKEEKIVNGENLIIEYVTNDCLKLNFE